MVVISDTTTITNLIQIDLLYILSELYGEILIPEAVYLELSEFEGHQQIIDSSDWIEVVKIAESRVLNELIEIIDIGEAEAIVLSIELKPNYLIIDELKGRRIAKEYNIEIIGLLGILMLSKKEGLVEMVKPYLEKLKNDIGFRISEKLYEYILAEVGEL